MFNPRCFSSFQLRAALRVSASVACRMLQGLEAAGMVDWKTAQGKRWYKLTTNSKAAKELLRCK